MALDPSIILQAGRGVTPLMNPAEIQDQQMQREIGTYKLNALRQQTDDDQAYRDVLRSGASPDQLPNKLYAAGLGKHAAEAQKFQSEQLKSKRDTEKAEIEGHLKKFELAGQIMNGVSDQATWDRARQQTAQVFGPQAAAQMPEIYDPALVEQKRVQAMAVKDQLAQKLQARGQDITMRGQDLTRDTSLRGQDLSRDTSIRGQDLTDSRAREFNATKVEQNNIKREEKQQTADMTKGGQIASFDTMLGTLDRLSTHKGLDRSVGIMSKLPTMPGSESANFQAELESFKSQAFVPMVAQLKGMGALSDAEGRKLTAAVGALEPSMGEKAFRESIDRIKADMNAARARVAGTAKGAATGDAPKAAPINDLSALEAELRRRGKLK